MTGFLSEVSGELAVNLVELKRVGQIKSEKVYRTF